MFIRAENLGQRTVEDIDNIRQNDLVESLKFSQKLFEEDLRKQNKSVSKYPDFAFKPVEELTQEERQRVVDAFFDKQIILMETLGTFAMDKSSVRENIKKLKKQRKAPVSDAELKDMRDDLFPPVKTQNPDEARIRKDFEKNIYFAINKSSLLTQDFDNLCEILEHYLESGKFVKVLIDEKMSDKENEARANYIYTPEEKKQIIKLHKLINEKGSGEIRFREFTSVSEDYGDEYHFNTAWTLEDVSRANKSLDSIVEYIKLSEFSPFETMVFIHDYITSTFQYKEGGIESSRVIPGAFKNGEIVCSGYASMVKAIIDKLDNKDLSCDIVGCSLYKGKLFSRMEGAHAHNMIHIRDEKYGIDGTYMEDACWDSKREEFPDGKGFAHCLYPVTDLEHFRGANYVPSTSADRFSNLISDKNEFAGDKPFVLRSSLPRPWMTLQYGEQSKPIPIEKYEECLKKVYGLKYEGDKAKTEERIDSSLMLSAFTAKMEFKNGDSCFSSTDRYKFKGRGSFSLAKNDGRARADVETEKE